MPTSLEAIQSLIEKGDKKTARQQLKQHLQTEPSAQAWYLAALVVDNPSEKVKCLQRALNLDALHTPSNRLMSQIQKSTESQQKKPQPVPMVDASEGLTNRDQKYQRIQQVKTQRRRRRGMGCLVSFMLSSIICVVILSLVGMIPRTLGWFIQLNTGVAPVYEINGVPIESIDDSVFQIAPVFSDVLKGQAYNVIDHGYVNEYTFAVTENAPYGIYLQFLSLNAHNLSENMVIVDSAGNNITSQCLAQKMSEYDSGLAYSCRAQRSEQWTIRIVGINGETTGGYIIGLQALEA